MNPKSAHYFTLISNHQIAAVHSLFAHHCQKRTLPFSSYYPLTTMENPSQSEKSRSHMMGFILENLILQCSIRMQAATKHTSDVLTLYALWHCKCPYE